MQVLAIALFAFLLELFLPWYSIAVAAFAMGFVLKSKMNFLAGFLGIALLWLLAAWIIDNASSAHLAERIAQLLTLKEKYLLMIVMAVIGGLVGGFAAMAGAALKPERKKYY